MDENEKEQRLQEIGQRIARQIQEQFIASLLEIAIKMAAERYTALLLLCAELNTSIEKLTELPAATQKHLSILHQIGWN